MAAGPDTQFVTDLGIAVLAAFVGGSAAKALKLPVLIGYFAAGLAIGPWTPGYSADAAQVSQVSNFGVALLMFAVGVQLHLTELNAVRRTAVLGGGAQILLCIGLGSLMGLGFGWPPATGLFVGGALALSSTAVVMRLLEERGEIGSNHGRVSMGILVIQDLSLVAMVAFLPLLSGKAAGGDLALLLLRPILVLAVGLAVALKLAPLFLDRVARLKSRELFVLAVVTLCLTAGFAAEKVGLGVALGAFFAGLVVSESSYAQEVFSQVRPLRDVFASIFFVSVGMMIDPAFVGQNVGSVLVLALAVLLVKPILVMIPLKLLGWQGRTIVLTGLGLANIGEFSFVFASLGLASGVVKAEVASLIISAALVTLVCAPFVMSKAGRVYYQMNRIPRLSKWLHASRVDPMPAVPPGQTFQAIVLGAGRVGRYVSEALTSHAIPHAVVDVDVRGLDRLKSDFMFPFFGDATSTDVLHKVHPKQAELAILALPDTEATQMALGELRRLSPTLFIVCRVHRGDDIPVLRAAGADAVIHGEFEAGVEIIRQTLRKLGTERDDVRAYLDAARQHRYREGEVSD